jgi:hypothetical protein
MSVYMDQSEPPMAQRQVMPWCEPPLIRHCDMELQNANEIVSNNILESAISIHFAVWVHARMWTNGI